MSDDLTVQLEVIAEQLIEQGYRIDQIESYARRGAIRGIGKQVLGEEEERVAAGRPLPSEQSATL